MEHLTVQMYVDADSPNMSVQAGERGVAIIQDIAPWVRLADEEKTIHFDSDGNINGDDFEWPALDGDLNLILTNKRILGSKALQRDSSLNFEKISGKVRYIGLSHYGERAGSKRAAIVDKEAIALPENTVAHELGHLLGVRPQTYVGHCIAEGCVMNAILPTKSRLRRTFCNKEAEMLYENADRLLAYKVGKLVISPNAKIFSTSSYL